MIRFIVNEEKIRVVQAFSKGTVSVILSEPPCKDVSALFTTVPLTAFIW